MRVINDKTIQAINGKYFIISNHAFIRFNERVKEASAQEILTKALYGGLHGVRFIWKKIGDNMYLLKTVYIRNYRKKKKKKRQCKKKGE